MRWWKDGYRSIKGYCLEIGGTTAATLRCKQETGEPFSGSTDPGSSGNGSIMSLSPVPVFYHASLDDAVHFAGESSRTTHGSEMSVDSCRFLAAVIWHALNGATKEFLTSPEVWDEPKFGELNPKVEAIRQGSYKAKTADQISNSGFVIHTLESAMFSFHNAPHVQGCRVG